MSTPIKKIVKNKKTAINNKKTITIESKIEEPVFRSCEERLAYGKELRGNVPRSSHAIWQPHADRRDPIEILEESNNDRLPELIPIRYGRMLRSPFAFLRGSASLMAYDLATTPNTGIKVQACGDCHLANFGLFATPERNLIFDINDFDETLPAPWEWDLKRLAISFVAAARDNQFSNKQSKACAIECARAYRKYLLQYSKMSPLEVWYDRLDAQMILEAAPDAKAQKFREHLIEKAKQRVGEFLYPKISGEVNGRHRLIDQPPLLYHINVKGFEKDVLDALESYRLSMPDERRMLFDRYRFEDAAVKVVGVGSVGTRCFVGLFFSADHHPLLLQFKEARASVLEPFAGKSIYENHGQRVVTGQRIMQSSSDIFLGWTRGRMGRDFFVRQLRDMKMSVPLTGLSDIQLMRYANVCGRVLARTHAKSGDSALISGYLGKSNTFDRAIGKFASMYADQNEEDYAVLVAAVKAGRIKILDEVNKD